MTKAETTRIAYRAAVCAWYHKNVGQSLPASSADLAAFLAAPNGC